MFRQEVYDDVKGGLEGVLFLQYEKIKIVVYYLLTSEKYSEARNVMGVGNLLPRGFID